MLSLHTETKIYGTKEEKWLDQAINANLLSVEEHERIVKRFQEANIAIRNFWFYITDQDDKIDEDLKKSDISRLIKQEITDLDRFNHLIGNTINWAY